METRFNRDVKFDDKSHEVLMGVWWSGVLLKKQAGRFFREHLAGEAQFNVLLLLKYAETLPTQQELSRMLLVDKSNITGLVDRMAAAGLIERVNVSGDRRVRRLRLTVAGREMIDQLEPAYRAEVYRTMAVFSAAELDTLGNLMRKLQNSLENNGTSHA